MLCYCTLKVQLSTSECFKDWSEWQTGDFGVLGSVGGLPTPTPNCHLFAPASAPRILSRTMSQFRSIFYQYKMVWRRQIKLIRVLLFLDSFRRHSFLKIPGLSSDGNLMHTVGYCSQASCWKETTIEQSQITNGTRKQEFSAREIPIYQ